jgi:hypothetical protein
MTAAFQGILAGASNIVLFASAESLGNRSVLVARWK